MYHFLNKLDILVAIYSPNPVILLLAGPVTEPKMKHLELLITIKVYSSRPDSGQREKNIFFMFPQKVL